MAEKQQNPGEATGPGAIIFGYPEPKDIYRWSVQSARGLPRQQAACLTKKIIALEP